MHKQFTRKLASGLAEEAMKAGLHADEAVHALHIGARVLAHGFTDADMDRIIRDEYRRHVNG